MCKFCEALDWKKKLARMVEKQYPNHRRVYSVALVDRIFVKGRKGGASSTSTDYRNKGCGYQLNFCPECGKYLKRGAVPMPIYDMSVEGCDFRKEVTNGSIPSKNLQDPSGTVDRI